MPTGPPIRRTTMRLVILFALAFPMTYGLGFTLDPSGEAADEPNLGPHVWAHMAQGMLCLVLAMQLHHSGILPKGPGAFRKDPLLMSAYLLLVWGAAVFTFDGSVTALFGDDSTWTHSLWVQLPLAPPVLLGLLVVGVSLFVRRLVRGRRTTAADVGPLGAGRNV